MLANLRPYLQYRLLPRLLFAVGAGVTALGLALVYEMAAIHTPRPEALLFPPIIEKPAPALLTRARPPVLPPPVVVPAPVIPAPEVSYTFALDVPAGQAGLKSEDFQVTNTAPPGAQYEVVATQYIQDAVTTPEAGSGSLVMLFDQSGSIQGPTGTDPGNLRIPAGQQFIDILPPTMQVAVYSFQGGLWSGIHPASLCADFTNDKPTLKAAIQSLQGQASGGTPTYPSLKVCLDRLSQMPNSGTKTLVCFTDGGADDYQLAPSVKALAMQQKVQINFITLGTGTDWTPYTDLATATGGKLYKVEEASALADAFAQLAKSLHTAQGHYHLTLRAHSPGGHLSNGDTLHLQVQASGIGVRGSGSGNRGAKATHFDVPVQGMPVAGSGTTPGGATP